MKMKNNNFNMDQRNRVPKILSSVEELQNPHHHFVDASQIDKIKHQMKNFIHDIKSQLSTIVNNYQQQISQLKLESNILKRSRQTVKTATTNKKPMSVVIKKTIDHSDMIESPVLQFKTNQFYNTAQSPFYRTHNKKQIDPFPSWGSSFQIRNVSPKRRQIKIKNENQFPSEIINPEFQHQRNFHRSRYERYSQRKRQNEEQIVHFLQSHQKNLNQTTLKMMSLIGKNPKQNTESCEGSSQDHQQNEQSQLKSGSDMHNRSLSQICDSLDKSFVSQRARKNKMKQKLVEQQNKKKISQQEAQNQKIRKQRAVKNLLQRLRQNANSVNPPEVVKASKLIPTGPKTSIVFKQSQPITLRKNSKVMINPVPMHTASRKNQQLSPSYNEKQRPASILKQSSNILTRSISGISAISFQE